MHCFVELELSRSGSRPRGDGSLDELDLTPLDDSSDSSGGRSFRNPLIIGGLLLVLGFMVFQALTSARVFYRNVDEAVAERAELGDETFRLQGTVVTEPTADANGASVFLVSFGGVDAEVRHVGEEPSDLFEIGVPIIAEGHWEGQQFESTQLLVKHSESYVEDNPDRVDYELEETVDQ